MRKFFYGAVLILQLISLTGCSVFRLGEGFSQEAPSSSQNPSSHLDNKPEPELEPEPVVSPVEADGEMRAVWIAYFELTEIFEGQTEAEAARNVDSIFDTAKAHGFNTVIVQVRPFGDALYSSALFPWSHILNAGGLQNQDPGYDPLAMMVAAAHEKDLEIHAWINPYRVQLNSARPPVLADDNIAVRWLNEGSRNVLAAEGGYYYNPARDEVIDLVVRGVEEVAADYQVDGIHFDDYFYPTTSADFDAVEYEAYLAGGGELGLDRWRQDNVSQLIKRVYEAVKAANPRIQFGLSPQGNLENNYLTQYADVRAWASTDGYIDYIMPQVYFGFDNTAAPYLETIAAWDALCAQSEVKLYIGLAPYKVGLYDQWAGEGASEWAENTDVLYRQICEARLLGAYKGFCMFRYDSIFDPDEGVAEAVSAELEAFRVLLEEAVELPAQAAPDTEADAGADE